MSLEEAANSSAAARNKDGPPTVPKRQFGFRKSFKKFTGTKSAPLEPEPTAVSVHRQCNISEYSPCNSIINDTSAFLEGSVAASESLTTPSTGDQLQVTDGESFLSVPGAKNCEPLVPTESLRNLVLEKTDASSPNRGTGGHSIKAAESDGVPCQDITTIPETLWGRAYDGLRSSKDPEKFGLVVDYERKVLDALKTKVTGRAVEPVERSGDSLLHQKVTNKALLDNAIEDALKQAAKGESSARLSFDKAGKLTLALQNFISEAVKASTEVSLVWAGVCLVLPILTQPVIADECDEPLQAQEYYRWDRTIE